MAAVSERTAPSRVQASNRDPDPTRVRVDIELEASSKWPDRQDPRDGATPSAGVKMDIPASANGSLSSTVAALRPDPGTPTVEALATSLPSRC